MFKAVWKSVMEEGIRESGGVGVADWQGEAMHLETWHKILVACDVDTVTGLHRYVEAWGARDPLVSRWMLGSEACQRPTADIGGWLVDYFNIAFKALSGQARHNVIYTVVENDLYRSLDDVIGPFNKRSKEKIWKRVGAIVLACLRT